MRGLQDAAGRSRRTDASAHTLPCLARLAQVGGTRRAPLLALAPLTAGMESTANTTSDSSTTSSTSSRGVATRVPFCSTQPGGGAVVESAQAGGRWSVGVAAAMHSEARVGGGTGDAPWMQVGTAPACSPFSQPRGAAVRPWGARGAWAEAPLGGRFRPTGAAAAHLDGEELVAVVGVGEGHEGLAELHNLVAAEVLLLVVLLTPAAGGGGGVDGRVRAKSCKHGEVQAAARSRGC